MSPPGGRMAVLEAISITRKSKGQTLLADVSLSICPGSRHAIVGPSGSGKTLLLRALAWLDPVDGGALHWHGNPVCGAEAPKFRSQVMYLSQSAALLEGSVEHNLRRPFALTIHRGKQFDRPRLLGMLDLLSRENSFLTKHQRELSGGESQIVALIRMLQLDPDILLLDEPTSALDGGTRDQVERLIDGWLKQQDHRAAVWITHDLGQAKRVADSIRTIDHGVLGEAMESGDANESLH